MNLPAATRCLPLALAVALLTAAARCVPGQGRALPLSWKGLVLAS